MLTGYALPYQDLQRLALLQRRSGAHGWGVLLREVSPSSVSSRRSFHFVIVVAEQLLRLCFEDSPHRTVCRAFPREVTVKSESRKVWWERREEGDVWRRKLVELVIFEEIFSLGLRIKMNLRTYNSSTSSKAFHVGPTPRAAPSSN